MKHELHEDGIHFDDVAPVGPAFIGQEEFDLWDYIGTGQTDLALGMLKERPTMASLNPVALGQSVALKAFLCEEKEVIDALLKNPHTNFNFSPCLLSPLMLAITNPNLHEYVEPTAKRAFAFRWPANSIIRSLVRETRLRMISDFAVYARNLDVIKENRSTSPELIEELQAHFEHELDRVNRTLAAI